MVSRNDSSLSSSQQQKKKINGWKRIFFPRIHLWTHNYLLEVFLAHSKNYGIRFWTHEPPAEHWLWQETSCFLMQLGATQEIALSRDAATSGGGKDKMHHGHNKWILLSPLGDNNQLNKL